MNEQDENIDETVSHIDKMSEYIDQRKVIDDLNPIVCALQYLIDNFKDISRKYV
jgi:hypothetical protein